MGKVKFIKSPTGKYNLAYSVGNVVDLKNKTLEEKLIKSGYAEAVKAAPKAGKKVGK